MLIISFALDKSKEQPLRKVVASQIIIRNTKKVIEIFRNHLFAFIVWCKCLLCVRYGLFLFGIHLLFQKGKYVKKC